ncbi:MAG: type ISP restriction/modification enzyme [Balneolaceae bacterium]|nr:type ISP restriction/modification enzyme [Balneolaceae bacterium]
MKDGFFVQELFKENLSGLATEFDDFTIVDSKLEAKTQKKDLLELNTSEIINKYDIKSKNSHKVERSAQDLIKNDSQIVEVDYRPFDYKYANYTGLSNGIMGRPRDLIHEDTC